MKTSLSTALVWAAALISLVGAGLLASMFALMATSLDPMQAVEAGLAPWVEAVYAGVAFVVVVVTTILALLAWHSRRFYVVGALLALAQTGLVVWASVMMYNDYF